MKTTCGGLPWAVPGFVAIARGTLPASPLPVSVGGRQLRRSPTEIGTCGANQFGQAIGGEPHRRGSAAGGGGELRHAAAGLGGSAAHPRPESGENNAIAPCDDRSPMRSIHRSACIAVIGVVRHEYQGLRHHRPSAGPNDACSHFLLEGAEPIDLAYHLAVARRRLEDVKAHPTSRGLAGLLSLLDRLGEKARERTGEGYPFGSIQEAGLDGGP